jgi:predicted MFS family arabinose efflux permease
MIIVSIHYTVWRVTVTALSTLFARTYNISELQIGLTYLANGFGSMIGTFFIGKLLDIEYRLCLSSLSPSSNTPPFPLQTARLRLLPLWITLLIPFFGWTHLHFRPHHLNILSWPVRYVDLYQYKYVSR